MAAPIKAIPPITTGVSLFEVSSAESSRECIWGYGAMVWVFFESCYVLQNANERRKERQV